MAKLWLNSFWIYDPLRKMRVMCNGLRLAMRDKTMAYKAALRAGLLAIAFAQRAWLDFGLVLVARRWC